MRSLRIIKSTFSISSSFLHSPLFPSPTRLLPPFRHAATLPLEIPAVFNRPRSSPKPPKHDDDPDDEHQEHHKVAPSPALVARHGRHAAHGAFKGGGGLGEDVVLRGGENVEREV
jgi:hypothetical protein